MSKAELLEIAKPLICNKEVAKSFVDGVKTQTRRLPKDNGTRYKKGDILWIREPARIEFTFVRDGINMMDYRYLSDSGGTHRSKIPKKHLLKRWMVNNKGVPNGCIKEMARMFYRVIDVQYEKLNEMPHTYVSYEAEGIAFEDENGVPKLLDDMLQDWRTLWNSTAPKGRKWEDNPLVEVYQLEKINI